MASLQEMEIVEEMEVVEVPRGDLDIVGHHLFLIASFDGICSLVNKESGRIYWRLETDGFLHIAKRGENVDDYADLKQGDYRSQLYHFKPENPDNPQLIPYETEELLEEYFNEHHRGVGTDVTMNEMCYLIEYQTGKVIHYFDSYSNGAVNNVFENKDWLDHFLIKRVDFYLHRSSPFWSLRFARIEAWFPHSLCPESRRTQCLVYHTPNIQSYVNACVQYKLYRFPSGCAINNLIREKISLSLKQTELEDENRNLKEKISNVNDLLSRNSRIDLTLLTENNRIKRKDDNESEFFKGTYDGIEALIEKARRDDFKAKKKVHRLWNSACHPNICTFLGWESDDKHDYFAFEKCHRTLRDFICDPSTIYKEMSEESIKIMSGLVSGISHLHSRNLIHKKLSLDNIWIDKNKNIKIGGLENCESFGKVQGQQKKSLGSSPNPTPEQTEDHRIDNLYDVGQFILVYMTKGIHEPPRAKTTLMTAGFDKLVEKGTNREVLDLLQKLNAVEPVPLQGKTPASKNLCNHIAFWPAPERLRYFQVLSNYLDEANPRPVDLRKAINFLKVVPLVNNKSDWRSRFKPGVFEAMSKLPEKPEQKKAAQDPKQAASSSQNPQQEKMNYYPTNVSLIRFMRNGYSHILTFSSRDTDRGRTLEDDLGSNASEFEETFRNLFPDLFVLVYAKVEEFFKDLPYELQRYYQA